MNEQAQFRGYISRQYTVWCGLCGNWEQVEALNIRNAGRRFKTLHWNNTRRQGWTCPACQKKK